MPVPWPCIIYTVLEVLLYYNGAAHSTLGVMVCLTRECAVLSTNLKSHKETRFQTRPSAVSRAARSAVITVAEGGLGVHEQHAVAARKRRRRRSGEMTAAVASLCG